MLGAAKLFDGVADPPPWGDPRIVNAVHRFADETFGPAPDAPEPKAMPATAMNLPYHAFDRDGRTVASRDGATIAR